jgi:hypothetical protein
MMKSKYTLAGMTSAFRLAAKFRNDANQRGMTDNIGAIHSAERILMHLAPLVVYGTLSPKQHRLHPKVTWSIKARAATRRGESTHIEHVAPHRALTMRAIELVTTNKSDEPLLRFIKRTLRLAVVTPDERLHLDRQNRSKIHPKRLEKAGIKIAN